jgi:hypothetical protein
LWQVGADQPVARLQPAGGVFWFDFSADGKQIAAHCVGPTDQRLQVWEVDGGRLTSDVGLDPRLFQHPSTSPMPDPRTSRRVRRPVPAQPAPAAPGPAPAPAPQNVQFDPNDGALSPGGKYAALLSGGRYVLVTIADGKPAGDCPWQDSFWAPRSVRFSADGREFQVLLCLPKSGMHGLAEPDQKARLRTWNMVGGVPAVDVTLATPLVTGPILPGPDADSLTLSGNNAQGVPLSGSFAGRTESAGVVIDRATGAVLSRLEFSPIARLADGWVAGFEPPPPPAPGTGRIAIPRRTAAQPKRERSAFCEKPDAVAEGGDAEKVRSELRELPAANEGDRSAVRTLRPEAPAGWAVPATRPAATDTKSIAFPITTVGQTFFAGDRAVVLTRVLHEQPKPHVTTELTPLDVRAGTAGKSLTLRSTPHQPPPPTEREPEVVLLGDLAIDGKIAIRDPDDTRRVDVWDAAGTWQIGFHVADRPVIWAGWSADGKLLTLAADKLTAWDIPAGKAIYEVETGKARAAITPDRTVVAVASPGHIDLLDTATGECRGRLDGPQVVWILAISADGQHLAALAPAQRGLDCTPRRSRSVKRRRPSGLKAGAKFVPGTFAMAGPKEWLACGRTARAACNGSVRSACWSAAASRT